jgi:hypothetical protein
MGIGLTAMTTNAPWAKLNFSDGVAGTKAFPNGTVVAAKVASKLSAALLL